MMLFIISVQRYTYINYKSDNVLTDNRYNSNIRQMS